MKRNNSHYPVSQPEAIIPITIGREARSGKVTLKANNTISVMKWHCYDGDIKVSAYRGVEDLYIIEMLTVLLKDLRESDGAAACYPATLRTGKSLHPA
jgi:hypothetical protein